MQNSVSIHPPSNKDRSCSGVIPGRRLAIAFACCLALAGCKKELYSGLSQREANQMLAVLELNGIEAERAFNAEGSTYQISVDDANVANGIVLLERNGFPRSNYASLGDVFKADGLVTSPFEERARYLYAMNEELAQSISSISGIYDARVHMVLPDSDPLNSKSSNARASVFVYHKVGFDVASVTRKIQLAVANSIDNLAMRDVVVMSFVAEDQLFLARR